MHAARKDQRKRLLLYKPQRRDGSAAVWTVVSGYRHTTQVATAIMNQWSKAHPGAKHNQWSEETAFYFKETTITTVKLSVSDYEAIWLLAWLLPTALGLLPPVTIPLQNWDKPSAYRQNWTNLLLINWTNQLHMEVNENNASRIKSQTNSLLMEQ